MAKQRQEEEEKLRDTEKKKMEKKALKEKRRLEMEESKKKQQQQQQQQQQEQQQQQKTQNHNENIQNGKTSRKELEKKTSQNRESRNSPHKTDKWSWLGLINLFLLSAVLVSACALIFLYSEGDLSEKGLRMAWERALNNSHRLVELTKETATIKNLKWAVGNVSKVLGPCALKVQETLVMGFSATRNLGLTSFQALQAVTGDLSPYVEGLISYWNALVRNLHWLLSKIDLMFILDGLRWFFYFMLDQVRVLNQEFWSNEAIISMWRDLKPFREWAWSNTVTLRYYYWQLGEEVTVTWLPLLKQLGLDLYDFAREKLVSFL